MKIGAIIMTLSLAVAASAEPVPLSPQQAASILRGADQDKKLEVARSLKLFIPKHGLTSSRTATACTEFDGAQLDRVVLEKDSLHQVMSLSSNTCDYSFLVVFTDKGHLVDTIALFTKASLPKVSFPELVSPGVHEVMFQNQTTDYGSGMQRYDTLVFKMVKGRLEVVFDEPVKVVFAIPAEGGNTDEEQTNSLSIVPSNDCGDGRSAIEERQEIRKHKSRIVRYQRFCWNSELNRFQAESFTK